MASTNRARGPPAARGARVIRHCPRDIRRARRAARDEPVRRRGSTACERLVANSSGARYCDGEQRVADRAAGVAAREHVAQGVEVAERLGHLLAVHHQVRAVQPVAGERLAGGRLALGDLVLVVRKDVVHAAGVDVEALAEVPHAHRGALDVPAGPAPAPRRVPADVAVLLVPRLPQREVGEILLLVLVLHAPARRPCSPDMSRCASRP